MSESKYWLKHPQIVAKAAPKKMDSGSTSVRPEGHIQKPTSAPVEQREAASIAKGLGENDKVLSSVAGLDIKDKVAKGNTEFAPQDGIMARAGLRFEDDRTNISTSSTKGTSVDGKSALSGITFALDEKESLRPDDSASVKAVDEDDPGSGAASGAPSSRLGSEAGTRAFRDQFQEISQSMRRGHAGTLRGDENGLRKLAPSAQSHQVPIPAVPQHRPTPVPRQTTEDTKTIPFAYEYKGPDDKLLEALQSSKDRMFLLKLEDQVIEFVTKSQYVSRSSHLQLELTFDL